MKTRSVPMKQLTVEELAVCKKRNEQRNTRIILQIYSVRKKQLAVKQAPRLTENDARRKNMPQQYSNYKRSNNIKEIIAHYYYQLTALFVKRSAT